MPISPRVANVSFNFAIAPGALAPQVALPQGVSFDADQQRYTAGGCFFSSHQGMSSTETSSPGACPRVFLGVYHEIYSGTIVGYYIVIVMMNEFLAIL